MPDKAARAQHINGELRAMRLRVTIGRHLEDQGMVTPAAIADATGLPPAEAIRLLNARKTRDGDIPALEAIARPVAAANRATSSTPGRLPGAKKSDSPDGPFPSCEAIRDAICLFPDPELLALVPPKPAPRRVSAK